MRTLAAQWLAGSQSAVVGEPTVWGLNCGSPMGPLHPGTAIDDFLAAYEAEHGEITEEQVVGAARRTRTRAVVVRGRGVA